MPNIVSYTLAQLPDVVELLYTFVQQHPIMTLEGSLGAGKTTLVKALLQRIGVQDVITSPTFSYMNSYQLSSGLVIYHFDRYRLTSLEEFLEFGFDEFLATPNSLVFIEWPEIIAPLLMNKQGVCRVVIDYDINDLNRRILQYSLQ